MMNIFYAVQATGNGHISRAETILPYLQKKGYVDVMLSGTNYGLDTNLPVVFRSKGISLEYNQSNGSIDIYKTFKNIKPIQFWKDAKTLPLEKYDLIINDFEPITSMICKLKGLPSIHFGHQASFQSHKVPRPNKRDLMGELILSNYATGTKTVGLHFKQYDSFIYPPIIKDSILRANPVNNGHITVYLAQYSLEFLKKTFSQFKNTSFQIFSNEVSVEQIDSNITVLPIRKNIFEQSLITCRGIITGGGFETPAEALYLGKKLMVIPIVGQYEQQCNAAALKKDFNVTAIDNIDKFFFNVFQRWLLSSEQDRIELPYSTEQIIDKIFDIKF